MKRRYKLLLIILIGIILTYLINSFSSEPKLNLVAIGDGIGLGLTSYETVGISYNDYLKDYLETKKDLESYNNEFCKQHLTVSKFNQILVNNEKGYKSSIAIKQILAKADIITIALGQDELTDYSMHSKIEENNIKEFLDDYERIIKSIRAFNENNIVIIGLYPTSNLKQNSVITINKKLSELAVNYKIDFYDLFSLAKNNEFYLKDTSYYMNYRAHLEIFKEIKEILNV